MAHLSQCDAPEYQSTVDSFQGYTWQHRRQQLRSLMEGKPASCTGPMPAQSRRMPCSQAAPKVWKKMADFMSISKICGGKIHYYEWIAIPFCRPLRLSDTEQ